MSDFERARDDAFDDLLDAIAAGEGYYLACENGHGFLPPRRVCPRCGDRDLTEEPLPDSGEIATFTEISVAAPDFSEDAPYVTAIAEFGPVSVTGMLPEVDPEAVELGMTVGVGVGERVTTGDRVVVFEPR
jgi:hypothetical protein